ncbi:MAG: hypothetical protein RI560_08930, partial [Natronomonas sp.]|nr:hypothetical protein [Natronomonas sp.]
MARFSKPDRTPPSERVETGIPEREGPPPDSGEEGARLDDVQESDNPGIDSPTRRADDDDDPFSK